MSRAAVNSPSFRAFFRSTRWPYVLRPSAMMALALSSDSTAFASLALAVAVSSLASFRPRRIAMSLGPLTPSTLGSTPRSLRAASMSPSMNFWRMPATLSDTGSSASLSSSGPSDSPASAESSSASESEASSEVDSSWAPLSSSELALGLADTASGLSSAASAAWFSAAAKSAASLVSDNWCSCWCGRCRLVCYAGEDSPCPGCVGRNARLGLRLVLVHVVRGLCQELVKPIQNLGRCVAAPGLQLGQLDLTECGRKVNPLRGALIEALVQTVVFRGMQPLVNLLFEPLLLGQDQRTLLLCRVGLLDAGELRTD